MKKSKKQKTVQRVNVTDTKWFNSNRTRPKTITVEFERTADGGYQVCAAAILNVKNQYSQEWVSVNPQDVARDISRLGIRSY